MQKRTYEKSALATTEVSFPWLLLYFCDGFCFNSDSQLVLSPRPVLSVSRSVHVWPNQITELSYISADMFARIWHRQICTYLAPTSPPVFGADKSTRVWHRQVRRCLAPTSLHVFGTDISARVWHRQIRPCLPPTNPHVFGTDMSARVLHRQIRPCLAPTNPHVFGPL